LAGARREKKEAGRAGKVPALKREGNDLVQLRKDIDRIDRRFIKLLAQRHQLIQSAAQEKIERSMDLWDQQRVEDILNTRSQWAKQQDLDPKLVQDLFRRIIDFNMRIERGMLRKRRKAK